MQHLPFPTKDDKAEPKTAPLPPDVHPPDHAPFGTNHAADPMAPWSQNIFTQAGDDNPLAARGPADLSALQMFADVEPDPGAAPPKIDEAKARAALAPTMAGIQTFAQEVQQRTKAAQIRNEQQRALNEPLAALLATKLVDLSRTMNAENGKQVIHVLDSIESADLREQVRNKFRASTNEDLGAFLSRTGGWNNDGPGRDQAAALALISPERDKANEEIRTMAPAVREAKQAEADAYASQILAGTYAHDLEDANQQKILRALQGRDPVEIEMIRASVRRQTHGESNLYQAIDNGMRGRHENAAVAMLAGDRVKSAEAVLLYEIDPARRREAVMGLRPDERRRVDRTYLDVVLDPADRAELRALLDGNTARANAERLGNLLQAQDSGKSGLAFEVDLVAQENYKRRASSNVMEEFESMSGDEVRAAAEEWNKHHSKSFEAMVAERWEDAEDKSQRQRLLAMIRGDKAQNRSLRFLTGLERDDQAMIEAALAHDIPTAEELSSKDLAVRQKANATMQENALFELYNVAGDQTRQRIRSIVAGKGDDRAAIGRSTHRQLEDHFKTHRNKDLSASIAGFMLGGGAEETIRAPDARKDQVGATELYFDGQLSTASEIRRAKDDSTRADLMEGIETKAELDAVGADYRKKFHRDMFSVDEDDREDMSAGQLRTDNLRVYGPVAARPAQLEYLLQAQQYRQGHSDWLERDEEDEPGGGTQTWQRQLLAAQLDLLQDKSFAVSAPMKVDTGMGAETYLDKSPTFAKMETRLEQLRKTPDLDDGLASGASKESFQALDRGMTAANRSQGDAKQRLADRVTTMIATVAKLTSILTFNPAIALVLDAAKATLDIAVKKAIQGDDYDSTLDVQVLAYTLIADAALAGAPVAGERRFLGFDKAAWDPIGKGVKAAVSTTGDAYKDNKSPVELLQSLMAEGVNLKLPEHLGAKVHEALETRDEKLAAIILEAAKGGVEIAAGATSLAVVGGQGVGEALATSAHDKGKEWANRGLEYGNKKSP